MGEALAKAKKDQKPVEVVGQREAASTTFANPDGTMSVSLSQRPTRAKQAGKWVPIDTTLAKNSKGRLAPKATSSKVTLRATASTTSTTSSKKATSKVAPAEPGAKLPSLLPADPTPGSTDDVAILDPPGAAEISMGFGADLPAPTINGDVANYALGGGAVLTTSAMDDGFTADVILAKTPATEPTYRFPLDLAGGLVPTLKDHTLQFSDAAGKLVAISRPLQMWDAQRDFGGDPSNVTDLNAALVQTPTGWELDLTAPMAFLTAPTTQYPVRVDPTVTLAKDFEGNTWYYSGNTTDRTASYYLPVGKKNDSGTDSVADRTYINFNTGQFLGKTVTSAKLKMYQYLAGSCSPKKVQVYPTKTRSSVDGQVQTDEGTQWRSEQTFNTGGNNCTPAQTNGYQDIDVTNVVTGWTTGEFPSGQFGMEIRAGSETDTAYYKRFCSETYAPSGTGRCEDATTIPLMVITYVPDLGTQSNYEMFTHKLNERSQLSINSRFGNAVVRANDLHVSGMNRDLSVDRFYNSQAADGVTNNAPPTSLGRGWSMSVGPDVGLLRVTPGNNDRFYYIAPGGTWYGPLVRKTASGDTDGFFEPAYGGSDVALTDKRDGQGTYELKFRHSQEKYKFKDFACPDPSCDFLPMISDRDRSDNEIKFNYGTTIPRRLTTIVDTENRTFNAHYSGAGFIDSISEAAAAYTPSPRTWAYGYNAANQLTSYTEPVTGNVTNYTYTSTAATATLQTITDPAQQNGTRPTTKLTYGSGGQATAVDYYLNAAGTSAKRFTLAYSSTVSDADANCHTDSNDIWTVITRITNVSDPQGNGQPTKYCYKDRDENIDPLDPGSADDNKPKQRIFDPLGHRRTLSFTPNNDVSTGAGQANGAETSGTTAYKYDANNNLTQAIQPKDDDTNSNVAGSTSFDYNTDKNTVAGGSFLPSSSSNTAGDCSRMNYDSKGNLTDTYTGIAGTNASTCKNSTGGRHNKVDYNKGADDGPDGTPHKAYSAWADTVSRTSADYTWYSYQADYPNHGKLTQVVRPGGNAGLGGDDTVVCGTNPTADRTGCTTYTYDGRSRATSITDGNGKVTSYTYDNDDRVTQVLTNGATTCTLTAGTCVTYAWDGEGNLATRGDIKGTTTFGYDWLNHPISQTQPDGTIINTAYDGAGNLTQYKQTLPGQAADTVNYTYDAANEMTTLADSTGSYTYTYDEDARPTKLTMPTASGVSIAYDYFHTGKNKSITPAGVSGLLKQTYDYGDGSKDTDKLHKITYGTGSNLNHVDYGYNDDDRLDDVNASWSAGTDYAYTYNANGDISGAKTTVNGTDTTVHYGYNSNDQLCWAGPTDGPSIDHNCPTTPTGNKAYASDKQGNSLGTTTGPLHYNAQNQADQLTSPAGGTATTMSYFDQGNDLRATAGADTFTGGTQLGVTSRRNGSGVTYYTRDPQGQLINTHGAGGTYYMINDRLGSTIALVTTTGGLAGTYTYDPYGKTTPVSGTSTTAAQNNPWRYTGGYQDPGDGYYKFGARYYDAAGHFTQADNIAGSLTRPEKYNSYTYTAGDPINSTDLSGNRGCAGSVAIAITNVIFFLAGAAAAIISTPTGVGLAITVPLLIGTATLLPYSIQDAYDACK